MGRLNRVLEAEHRRRTTVYAPGDRVVWRGMIGDGCSLVYAGTYVGDGPAPYVTVHHDGAPSDAQVRPERLYRESEYLALADARGYQRPTAWG